MRDALCWRARHAANRSSVSTKPGAGGKLSSNSSVRRSASELLREGGQAQFVTCDACDDAHREEVIWRSSVREPSGMRAYIPCPVEMVLHVPAERIKQWSVDADEMARQIAAAMELAGTVENVLVGRL